MFFEYSSEDFFADFGSIGSDVSTNTDSVCPSITGTRVQVQLTLILAGSIFPFFSLPSIFAVSILTFCSSFGMYGIILSVTSIADTPGALPAPEIACIDVIKTFFAPYSSYSGFIVITSPVVVQLGRGA